MCTSPTSTLFPYTTLFRSCAASWRFKSMDLQLQDQVILVLGGNGTIGADVVNVLKSEGAIPLVASRSSELSIEDRKSTRLNSSHVAISYAVFCLKKKKRIT